MNVKFHPDADAELMEARRWYEKRSAIAERAFGTEVAWAIREIQKSPSRWVRDIGGTRRFFLPNFPFSVVYCEGHSSIEIVAVAHHQRRPRYWLAR